MGGMPSNWFETIVLHCWETWRENSHRPASSCLELDFPAENLGIFGVFWGSMLVWRIRWVDECIRMLQGWGGHEWKELSSLILMTPAAMQLGVVQQDEEVGHLTNEMQSAKSHHLEDAKAYSQQISTDAIGQLGLDLIGQVVPRTSAAGMKQVAREVELHHACHNHVSINKLIATFQAPGSGDRRGPLMVELYRFGQWFVSAYPRNVDSKSVTWISIAHLYPWYPIYIPLLKMTKYWLNIDKIDIFIFSSLPDLILRWRRLP